MQPCIALFRVSLTRFKPARQLHCTISGFASIQSQESVIDVERSREELIDEWLTRIWKRSFPRVFLVARALHSLAQTLLISVEERLEIAKIFDREISFAAPRTAVTLPCYGLDVAPRFTLARRLNEQKQSDHFLGFTDRCLLLFIMDSESLTCTSCVCSALWSTGESVCRMMRVQRADLEWTDKWGKTCPLLLSIDLLSLTWLMLFACGLM